VPLSEVKDDLSHFLREAETSSSRATQAGRVLIGFKWRTTGSTIGSR